MNLKNNLDLIGFSLFGLGFGIIFVLGIFVGSSVLGIGVAVTASGIVLIFSGIEIQRRIIVKGDHKIYKGVQSEEYEDRR